MKNICLALAASSLLMTGVHAQTLDSVVFGNTSSEGAHYLSTYFPPATVTNTVAYGSWVNTPPPSDPSFTPPSDVVSGGLGLSARRLLPRTPNGDVYGGQMTFTMTVDPLKQNYFTLKMWGSETNGSDYLLLNCNGKEVGIRHGGGGLQADSLWESGGSVWYANRFFYRTLPLPMSMTQGKTSVTMTVRASGSQFDYAPMFTYVPQYQSIMKQPSEGMYAGYTHTGSTFDASAEVQGVAPTYPSPNPSITESNQIAYVESNVNSQLAGKISAAATNLGEGDADYLAQCYDARVNYGGSNWMVYPSGQSDATLGNLVVAILDNFVTKYATNTGLAGSDWGGGFAPMGDAILLSWPLISNAMSVTNNYGGVIGTTTRQVAWATALRMSVDDGRYGRQNIGNQALDNAYNIFRANAGLLLVNSNMALAPAEGIRYMKEACGLQPWLGNDQTNGGTDGKGGGPVPTYGTAPYGTSWYMSTSKGLTKDGAGFVGGDYGEVGASVYHEGAIARDAQLMARGIQMVKARAAFRYPEQDSKGYLIMYCSDPIGDRNSPLPGHIDYFGSTGGDDQFMASQGASAIGNDLMGYVQQQIAEGQYLGYLYYHDPYAVPRWLAIKAQAQTGIKMPQAIGQPDFAWADEQDMVVGAKHGEERFYVNMFWRQPGFINGLAKVFDLMPTYARIGDVMLDDVRFRSTGQTITTGYSVDGFAPPADNPQEAFGGLPMMTAYRSDLSSVPTNNRDAGRGTGYTLRYGNWLIGMNADYTATYSVKLPADFTSATDLISGQVLSGPVVLQPQTSAVFYLPSVADTAPIPSRSLYCYAVGSNGRITVSWAYASAASSYNVLRSTTTGGPYTAIATGLSGTSFVDTAVTNGTTYYYVVAGINARGSGGNSPEASASVVSPQSAGLPSPWTDIDLGISTNGSAALTNGTFTVRSGPCTDGGTTDGSHLVYQVIGGDGMVTAQVLGQSSVNGGALAGVTMRDNLLQNPTKVDMVLQGTNHATAFYCGGDSGGTGGTGFTNTITTPYWMRLVRSGSTLTGLVSSNGVTWNQVGSFTPSSLPYNLYVGLFVNTGSSSAGQSNTATFTNVTLPLGSTNAPSAPTNVAAQSMGLNTAAFSWNQVLGAVSYNVKRSTSASGPFSVVGNTVSSSYNDYGLTNGTTYYYEVSGVNGAGEGSNSAVASVGLLPVPPALSGLSVSSSATNAVLNWGADSGASSYTISVSTNYAGPYTVIASGMSGTSYTNAVVTPGTLYYYKITPINGSGSGIGQVVSSLAVGALPAPWLTQDVGGNIPGAAGYSNGVFTLIGNGAVANRYVYQSLSNSGAMTIRVTGEAGTNQNEAGIMICNTLDSGSPYLYVEIGATTNSTYYYWSYRSSTNGTVSGRFGGVTTNYPCWLRVIRYGSSFTAYYSANGTNWKQDGNFTLALNPVVFAGMAVSSDNGVDMNTATIDNVALTTSLTGGTNAVATASSGSSGAQAAQAFDGNLGTKWYNNSNGLAGWLQYQFGGGVAQTVSQYQLISANDVPQRDPANWQFQGSQDGTNWTVLDTQSGQSFANRIQPNLYSIANTNAYQYYRLNINSNAGGTNYGIQLEEVGLYVQSPGNIALPPAVPLDLSVAWSNATALLSWNATFGASSYTVSRASNTGGPYTVIASGLTNTGYSDMSATDGVTYYYVVQAINAGGASAYSVENSATPYGVPAAPMGLSTTFSTNLVGLSWNSVSGATGYLLGRSTTSGGPYMDLGVVNGTNYTDLGLITGVTYYYEVQALNLGGVGASSAETSAIPLPTDAPWNFATSSGNTVATLTWNTPVNATNVTGYTINRATTSGGPYTTVNTNVPGTSYVDTGLTNGTTYYYVVTPLLGGMNGPDSSLELAATPSASTNLLIRSLGGVGTGTTTNGDNPQESPARAFDANTSTKWYDTTSPATNQPSTLQYFFGNNLAWAVTQYQITSANDVSQRDPSAWQFQGSEDGLTWSTLDTQSGVSFAGRAQVNTYTLTNMTPYRYYRLNVTANSGGSAYGLQLSEFTLLSSPSDPGDKTLPVISVPSTITTTATNAAGAVVNFSVTATDAVSGSLIATCVPGSGSTFPIGTNTVLCNSTDLAGNLAATNFTVVINGVPAVATASSDNATHGEGVTQAFDTNLGTKWYNYTGTGALQSTGWIQYQFTNFTSKVVVGYAITSANDVSQRDPASWQFMGSQDGTNWIVLDTQTSQSFSSRYLLKLYNSFTNTSAYSYYRLNITANNGGANYGLQLSDLSFVYPLPSPWSSSDIGGTGTNGAVGADSGTFTMIGAGTDITGTADAFRYSYQAASGDCSIIARVAAFANANSNPRAGIMIRESLNTNSAHASVVLTPSNGIYIRYRSSTGGSTTSIGSAGTAPYWVKLTRSSNTFTFFTSSNGVAWNTVTNATIPMATNVYIGTAITSGTVGTLTISTEDNVTPVP